MGNTCYLTINEFPSEDGKKRIDFLEKRRVPAILFCRGDRLEKRIETGIEAVKKGFILGNHSYNHPDFNNLNLEKAKDQIEETDQVIDTVYRQAGLERKKKYFRFPYFNRGGEPDKIEKLQEFLEQLGYEKPSFRKINYSHYLEKGHQNFVDVSYTYSLNIFKLFDTDKEKITTVKDILDRIEKDTSEKGFLKGSKSRDIIVTHDHPFSNRNLSLKAFKQVIDKMLAKGMDFRIPSPHINPYRDKPSLRDFFK